MMSSARHTWLFPALTVNGERGGGGGGGEGRNYFHQKVQRSKIRADIYLPMRKTTDICCVTRVIHYMHRRTNNCGPLHTCAYYYFVPRAFRCVALRAEISTLVMAQVEKSISLTFCSWIGPSEKLNRLWLDFPNTAFFRGNKRKTILPLLSSKSTSDRTEFYENLIRSRNKQELVTNL